jgi:predicted anti-sigma-YlaC factor YlaD
VHDSGPTPGGYTAGDLSAGGNEVTCRQFVELVTDYFEGALRGRTLGQVEEHLVMCDWCLAYVRQMQSTIAALHDLREPNFSQPGHAVLEALRTRKEAGR